MGTLSQTIELGTSVSLLSRNELAIKSDIEVSRIFINRIKKWLSDRPLDTNEIFLRIMKMVFTDKILIGKVDLLKLLTENFEFSETQKWIVYDELIV